MRAADQNGKQLDVWTREIENHLRDNLTGKGEQSVSKSWLDEMDWNTDDNDAETEEEKNEPNDVIHFINTMIDENAAHSAKEESVQQDGHCDDESEWKTVTRKPKRSWGSRRSRGRPETDTDAQFQD